MPDSFVSGWRPLKDLIPTKNTDDRFNIFRRWGLRDDDVNAKAVKARLARIWRGWSRERKMELLLTVESIVRAEADKQAWPGFSISLWYRNPPDQFSRLDCAGSDARTPRRRVTPSG